MIQTVLTLIFRAALGNPDDDAAAKAELEKEFDDIKSNILESIFPTLIIISIAISSGLFIITPVTDR
jgi:hypothetical protein